MNNNSSNNYVSSARRGRRGHCNPRVRRPELNAVAVEQSASAAVLVFLRHDRDRRDEIKLYRKTDRRVVSNKNIILIVLVRSLLGREFSEDFFIFFYLPVSLVIHMETTFLRSINVFVTAKQKKKCYKELSVVRPGDPP